MSVFNKDNQPLADELALQQHIDRALAVKVPSTLEIEIAYRAVKGLFNPMVLGMENIPDRPCLFVGNHSLFALDGVVIMPVLLKKLRRFPRSMGDKFLFSNQLSADILIRNGAVMGHPQVCSALMNDGQDLLVFPGGAHESVKPASELYELQWKERYGFVKLAASHGYPIMPFGLVGPDEFYGHIMEGQELPHSAVGRLATRLGLLDENFRSDILPPVPIGSLGTPFPKPQRCYLGFGQPIKLDRFKGQTLSKKSLKNIRAKVAQQIETQLTELLPKREQHKGSDSLLRRLLTL
ncbi:MAG: lysophospholipid acyltransferase family protein [Halioglobus sp.]|nr:lysophospholipid acyltransferase family protein [Halioglobus sp.]